MSCGFERKTHHTDGLTFSLASIAQGTAAYESRSINYWKSRTIFTKSLVAVRLNCRSRTRSQLTTNGIHTSSCNIMVFRPVFWIGQMEH